VSIHPARGAALLGAAIVVVLVAATGASAHAIVSPPVAEANALQQFTLSVPTEKEGAVTTKVELTVPAGFAIDSFEPPPAGWKQSARSTGSGEDAVVQSVTWTGGSVPTDQDAVFRFNASADASKTYTFGVRQTYADGSVVDWNGPESSDNPAPSVEGIDSFGGGRSGSTLAIVALVVGALGLLVGLVSLVGGRRPLT
jgi:periplasmic copper chaperone A